MARVILHLCSVASANLLWALATSTVSTHEDSCDVTDASAACSSREVEKQEQEESAAARLEMLQAHTHKQTSISAREAIPVHDTIPEPAPATSSHEASKKEVDTSEVEGLTTQDHNGNMCMLCGKPLPERVNRTYTEFRKDCGAMSSPTGPQADVLKKPVAQLIQTLESGVERNGFCQLNFAKSCADAVANKDYLYWAKSLDLKAPAARENAAWDGRYCRLNGFLDAGMVALQHDFHGTQAKAKELCKTKYSKYNLENITFMDMMSAARYDDKDAPTHAEAELLAAWNCAMGDLGCDMSLCAYSFCDKGSGTGLYDECKGWHPVHGMPTADRF